MSLTAAQKKQIRELTERGFRPPQIAQISYIPAGLIRKFLSEEEENVVEVDMNITLATRTDTTKLYYLLTMLQEDYTTIKVQLSSGDVRSYTYKWPTNTGVELRMGDLVVVPVNSNDQYKIGTVMEVHDEPQINPDRPFVLRWVVQKVALEPFLAQVQREHETVEMMKISQRTGAKERARAELKAMFPNYDAIVKTLKGE